MYVMRHRDAEKRKMPLIPETMADSGRKRGFKSNDSLKNNNNQQREYENQEKNNRFRFPRRCLHFGNGAETAV